MDHHSSGCLPEEKFPTFASGLQGRRATTLSDFRRQFHLTSITLLSIFLLIACGFRKLAGHGVECQAMAAEY